MADPLDSQAAAFAGLLRTAGNDVDAAFRRALEAGGTAVQEPVKKDDDDRRGGVMDPGGTTWWIATKVA